MLRKIQQQDYSIKIFNISESWVLNVGSNKGYKYW